MKKTQPNQQTQNPNQNNNKKHNNPPIIFIKLSILGHTSTLKYWNGALFFSIIIFTQHIGQHQM